MVGLIWKRQFQKLYYQLKEQELAEAQRLAAEAADLLLRQQQLVQIAEAEKARLEQERLIAEAEAEKARLAAEQQALTPAAPVEAVSPVPAPVEAVAPVAVEQPVMQPVFTAAPVEAVAPAEPLGTTQIAAPTMEVPAAPVLQPETSLTAGAPIPKKEGTNKNLIIGLVVIAAAVLLLSSSKNKQA